VTPLPTVPAAADAASMIVVIAIAVAG